MGRAHLLGAPREGVDVGVDGSEGLREICELCYQLLTAAPAFVLYLFKNVLPDAHQLGF